MGLQKENLRSTITNTFKQYYGPHIGSQVDGEALAAVLHKLGLVKGMRFSDWKNLICAAPAFDAAQGCIDYEKFVEWLVDSIPSDILRSLCNSVQTGPVFLPELVVDSLTAVAQSLLAWSAALATLEPTAAEALAEHAATLKLFCIDSNAPIVDRLGTSAITSDDATRCSVVDSVDTSSVPNTDNAKLVSPCVDFPADFSIGAEPGSVDTMSFGGNALPEDNNTFMKMLRARSKASRSRSKEQSQLELSFREQAAKVVERTGKPGDCVDDLKEIAIAEVKDKLAISYWRFCDGLRVYRSDTVTKALMLICSAPVPGLGGTSYLEVFNKLTESSAWENHIYLFGGLVRDILRRTVGNDIDIGFSAPARELEAICREQGYTSKLDGDYILIGDEAGDEYLEGMVISYNGIQPPEHADFSMNTLFFDFKNEVVIDKTGIGVPAVMSNRLDLPCPGDRWKSWIEINGVRVCFRYYKFLLRGYSYDETEMTYVVKTLLDFWNRDPEHTIEVGRIALGNLVGSSDAKKIEKLRQIVLMSFSAVGQLHCPRAANAKSRRSSSHVPSMRSNAGASFFSASSWWQKGWLLLLQLEAADHALGG